MSCSLILGACTTEEPPDPSPQPTFSKKVLLFTKTQDFRHDSITRALSELVPSLKGRGLALDHTEDAAVFTEEGLAEYVTVVFLLTSGDVLNEEQQVALEAYVRGGGGWTGVHSASDTEFDWPFYGELVGAWFADHPPVQKASVDIVEFNHPSTRQLPRDWEVTDEWYNFRSDPSDAANVLLSVDEETYSGGTMGDPHPIAWCHTTLQGHSFYTAMGHTNEIWADPTFLGHVLGGIVWSAKLGPGDCELDGGPSL